MNKSALLWSLAAVCLCLIASAGAAEMDSSQMDGLAAKYLPSEFKNFTMNDVKKVLYAKCVKVNGKANFTLLQDIQAGATKMLSCLSGVANLTALQEEMEIAKPQGDLDVVFDKYCQKAPIVEACLAEFNEKLQPCLSVAERQQNAIFARLVKNMFGYVCAKGGDQIALFIAEEGPECIEANREPLSHCVNASLSEFLPITNFSGINLKELPDLVLSPRHCIDLERFEACTVHHLEQCVEITPANVVESVFKFIKKEVNCTNWAASQTTVRPILKQQVARSAAAEPFALNMGLSLALALSLLLSLSVSARK